MAETYISDSLRAPSGHGGFIGHGNPTFTDPVDHVAHGVILGIQDGGAEEAHIPAAVMAPVPERAGITSLRFGALLRKLNRMDPNDPRRALIIQKLRNLETYARDQHIIHPEDNPVEYLVSLIDGNGNSLDTEESIDQSLEFRDHLERCSEEQVEEIDARIWEILTLLRGVHQGPQIEEDQPENVQPANSSYLSVAIPIVASITALAIQYFFTT